MKKHSLTILLLLAATVISCTGNKAPVQETHVATPQQEALLQQGWQPCIHEGGELSADYGVKPEYGIQDNYFDMRIGKGYSVAIKIVDAATNKCIRYVYVPEDEMVTVGQIPQGRYYLKLAYGKDWMEKSASNIIKGKFTKNSFYEKSASSFDFGKKNSQELINYSLELNVVDGNAENNFKTIVISEDEFNQN